ncbi:MAG TPA: branched-chain amino acid ABC transporter permease [Symbiobacteriaceae bacterium]|nr:branched-chain amino acid ABC transporter permease [Symbiobacteriaceae bacterium]
MSYYISVLQFFVLNSLLGLSVYLVLSTGQLTLGNAGFMSIGAYTAALLSTKLAMPFWVTVPAGALAAAVVAIPLGAACLRLSGVYLAVATLGFSESIRVLWNGMQSIGGPMGISGIPSIPGAIAKAIRSIENRPEWLNPKTTSDVAMLLLFLAFLGLILFFLKRQEKGRVGRAFAAIRANEIAAGAMGIDPTYYKVLAFVQGALIAGLAGALSAHLNFAIAPAEFGFARAIEMLSFVVIGGTGLPLGPILGSGVMAFLSEALREATSLRFILLGLLMMAMMAIRPQGLLKRRVGA